jgi:hypothetical protein
MDWDTSLFIINKNKMVHCGACNFENDNGGSSKRHDFGVVGQKKLR